MTPEHLVSLDETQGLISDVASELAKLKAPTKLFEHMQRSALTHLQLELGELFELLALKKHKLVFIGQVYVGKTTAICHLTGLTATRTKKKKSVVKLHWLVQCQIVLLGCKLCSFLPYVAV